MFKLKHITKSRPLHIRNKFRTGGVKQRAFRIITAPLTFTVPNYYNYRAHNATDPLNSLVTKNFMNDPDGVDLDSTFSGMLSLPSGVTSVENAEKAADTQRKIERYNAGILSGRENEIKRLYKIAKKQREAQYRQKLIQWLAETDELDEVPAEFTEEVNDYLGTLTDEKRNEINARKQRRKERRQQAERRKKASDTTHKEYQDRLMRNIALEGNGWRAPRLYSLLKPVHPLTLTSNPNEVVENEKNLLNDFREMYKEQQLNARGIDPPNSMVERAFPKTAYPITFYFKSH